MKGIHDVIKHAKFGDDRLRGSGVVADQISAFPVDFAGRPYNTLTLPCERVMGRRASTKASDRALCTTHRRHDTTSHYGARHDLMGLCGRRMLLQFPATYLHCVVSKS